MLPLIPAQPERLEAANLAEPHIYADLPAASTAAASKSQKKTEKSLQTEDRQVEQLNLSQEGR